MENINPGTNTNSCGSWKDCCKGHKVWSIIIVVVVLLIIGRMFGFGGHDWKGSNDVISTITVAGTGEVIAKPDIATISFGVTVENLDVAKAQTESNTKMNNIIDALKAKGVEEKDIKTTNYSVYPRYDYIQTAMYPSYGGRQTLIAYVVSQNVEVKIRDLTKAGDVLSAVGTLGVTDVSGLNFSLDKIDEVKDQAKALAIEDAKAQAKVLANSLGVRLVRITSFSEGGNYPMYYGMEKSVSMGMGGDATVPAPQVMAGESKITSNVSITYEIK